MSALLLDYVTIQIFQACRTNLATLGISARPLKLEFAASQAHHSLVRTPPPPLLACGHTVEQLAIEAGFSAFLFHVNRCLEVCNTSRSTAGI